MASSRSPPASPKAAESRRTEEALAASRRFFRQPLEEQARLVGDLSYSGVAQAARHAHGPAELDRLSIEERWAISMWTADAVLPLLRSAADGALERARHLREDLARVAARTRRRRVDATPGMLAAPLDCMQTEGRPMRQAHVIERREERGVADGVPAAVGLAARGLAGDHVIARRSLRLQADQPCPIDGISRADAHAPSAGMPLQVRLEANAPVQGKGGVEAHVAEGDRGVHTELAKAVEDDRHAACRRHHRSACQPMLADPGRCRARHRRLEGGGRAAAEIDARAGQ
jgi:hypothetical protein